MASMTDFSKGVPGFEFLQGLMKNAGAALPDMGQWIAPTLKPQELEKRIGELRTVQFWLEQNARMLAATIQALEVQRMTLSTLETMNLSVGDIAAALKLKTPAAEPASALGSVDPMQWWNALTQQFGQLAAGALAHTTTGPATGPAQAAPASSSDQARAAPKKAAARTARAAPRTPAPARRR